MVPSRAVTTGYGHYRDLRGPVPDRRFLFSEHTIRANHATPFRRHPRDYRTFVVLQGQVALERPPESGGSGGRQYGYLTGWHALPGSVYRIANRGGGPAVVIEAGSLLGEHIEPAEAPRRWVAHSFAAISTCPVDTAWGHEICYTQNVPNAQYSMKRVHRTAGGGSGRSARPGELQLVIADTDCTTIEVSSPERDDMIVRPGRAGPARLDAECVGGRR